MVRRKYVNYLVKEKGLSKENAEKEIDLFDKEMESDFFSNLLKLIKKFS